MNACLWQVIYVHVCFGHSYVSAAWVLWVNSSVPEQLCTEKSKQRESIPFQWAESWEKSTVLAPCTGPLFCCVSNVVRHSRTACRVSGVFRNMKTLLYSQLCPQADGCSFVLVHVMLGGVEHIDFKAALVQSPLSLRSGSLKHITVVCHITKDLLLGASALFKEWRGSSPACIQTVKQASYWKWHCCEATCTQTDTHKLFVSPSLRSVPFSQLYWHRCHRSSIAKTSK